MIHYYQSDVTKLSDEELRTLADEIMNTGLLEGDNDGEWEVIDAYGPETWQFQAHQRWGELTAERYRRYDLAHPELRGAPMLERINALTKEYMRDGIAEFLKGVLFSPRLNCQITGIAIPMDGGTYIKEQIQYEDRK